ncbi:MAG: hypothetical protein JW958_05575 [Candidatus Eisenbacteria bacterium]|nr:hypothetical protein [Candidatus Eisenbacteria bacterium]
MQRVWKLTVLTLLAIPLALLLVTADAFAGDMKKDKAYKQISIMEKIIDEAMVESRNALVRSSQCVRGVYLEGYGPVFTLEVGLVDEGFGLQKLSQLMKMGSGYTVTREEDEDEGETVITIQRKKGSGDWDEDDEEMAVTDEERYGLVKKELIEVIRDYGDTIARASSDDWFTLFAVPLQTAWTDKDIRRLVIKVQMKYISDFNAGKLDAAGFEKHVQIVEY